MARGLRLLTAALAWLAALAAGPAASADLAGTYRGLDAAAGMRLELRAAGEALRGVLTEADGAQARFDAEVLDGLAEATVQIEGRPALLRVIPEPAGAQVVIVPTDGQGGLDFAGVRAMAFLREGLELPKPPDRFLPAPQGPVRAFDARAFVDSYPFWPPLGAAFAYEAVEPRFRTLIRLFPLVHADLLWRLCQSPQRTEGLAEALRGQGVTCAQVVEAVWRMQAGGAFGRFKRDAAAERALLITALGCADDVRRNDPACRRAAAETARRAVSMETTATLLRRYR